MLTPSRAYLSSVVAASEAPCVSIYLPTHRSHPDNAQDPIRFKNLVKQVEESLSREEGVRDVRAMIQPLHALQANEAFWNHTLDGVAVLASATRFDAFTIARAVPELAIVAKSFHVKPLLRHLQSADRFHVLALSREKQVLFEGNRYALDPIPMPRPSPAVRSPAPSDVTAQVVVGEGITGYFRGVDRAVSEEVSKPSGLPLLLAGLAENMGAFRAVSENPHLLAEGISVDPFALAPEQLRARAWDALEPHYLARLASLSNDFRAAASHQRGTGDLSDAARAAVSGQVGVLLLDADSVQPGRIDPVTGAIRDGDLAAPGVDDKLDDLAEIVIRMGGEVVVVPGDRMPVKSGLAAIYRF